MKTVVKKNSGVSEAPSTSSSTSTVGPIIYMLIGPIVWASHLTTVYGVQSIVCAVAANQSTAHVEGFIALVIGLATAIALLLLFMPVWRGSAALSLFGVTGHGETTIAELRAIAMLLIVLSMYGIAATAATALVIPVCSPLR